LCVFAPIKPFKAFLRSLNVYLYLKLSSKLIGTSSPHDCLIGQIFCAI
jgi:hypothetical protein